MLSRLVLVLVLLSFTSVILSQGRIDQRKFKAEFLIGGNFSQLDGDGLSGFNKIGLRLGPRILYAFANDKGLALSMQYDQKGSASGVFGAGGLTRRLSLNYISIPIGAYFGSWWDEDYSDHRVKFLVSVIPCRLINVSSTNPDFGSNQDRYRDWDLSVSLGISYALGRRISADLGIERSLLQIYQPPNQDSRALQSYLVSVQLSYKLYQPGS